MPIERAIYKLKIDEEFKRLIPPLSDKERKTLEESIIKEGCRDAICVWHMIIVDGHNRYEICSSRRIPFAIKHISAQNRAEAIVWICSNQLGRRNIDSRTRQYLIGKRYEMEKIIGARNAAGRNQHSEKEVWANSLPKPPSGGHILGIDGRDSDDARRTRERLGEEYGISHASVLNYASYAEAIDKLSKAVPEIYEQLMSGLIKITQKDIIKLIQLPPVEMRRVVDEFTENPTQRIDFSSTSAAIPKNMPLKEQLAVMQIGAIKDMPEYDPDAEIRSLSLTIPSWSSSISHVLSVAKFKEASVGACKKLNSELYDLMAAIKKMIKILRGEKNND